MGRATAHTAAAVCLFVLSAGCENKAEQAARSQAQPTAALGASASLRDLMAARSLSEADVEAALKTYMPSGRHDDYLIFASGGQAGQVLVIGVPSMRLLKVIGVFAPEPWQGYGYAGTLARLRLRWHERRSTRSWRAEWSPDHLG